MAKKPAQAADDATPMLSDYTQATFPIDVNWSGGTTVRLYGTMSGRVFGVAFRTYERDGETFEEFSQSLDWDGQGVFSNGAYTTMNLVPPPAMVTERTTAIEAEIADAQNRLDAMPDAPKEWRDIDVRRIARLSEQLEKLS